MYKNLTKLAQQNDIQERLSLFYANMWRHWSR